METSIFRHDRLLGRAYAGAELGCDFDADDEGRFHVLVSVDPDTRGAGVYAMHDFGPSSALSAAPLVHLECFDLCSRDDGAPMIDAFGMLSELRSVEERARIALPLCGRLRSRTFDAFVEDGHAHGSYVAGRNVGIAFGVVESWLARWPYTDQQSARRQRELEITTVSPNRWVCGLFSGATVEKAARVQYCCTRAPAQVRTAIESARNQRRREAIADAWCIALYAMHRTWDEACMLAYPAQPRGRRLAAARDDELQSPWRTPLSTLTVPELKAMLRVQGLPTSGVKGELLSRVRASAAYDV